MANADGATEQFEREQRYPEEGSGAARMSAESLEISSTLANWAKASEEPESIDFSISDPLDAKSGKPDAGEPEPIKPEAPAQPKPEAGKNERPSTPVDRQAPQQRTTSESREQDRTRLIAEAAKTFARLLIRLR